MYFPIPKRCYSRDYLVKNARYAELEYTYTKARIIPRLQTKGLRLSCDKEFHIRSIMVMWITNLETLMDIPIFLHCSTNPLGTLLEGDMILLYYTALHVWLSPLLQLAVTLSSFHARRQEGISTLLYEDRPLKSWGGGRGVWFLYFVISVVPYPLLLIYIYSDCNTIIEYTCGRWIQFVHQQSVFVLHVIYICVWRL